MPIRTTTDSRGLCRTSLTKRQQSFANVFAGLRGLPPRPSRTCRLLRRLGLFQRMCGGKCGFFHRVNGSKRDSGLTQGWRSCFCIKTTRCPGLLRTFTHSARMFAGSKCGWGGRAVVQPKARVAALEGGCSGTLIERLRTDGRVAAAGLSGLQRPWQRIVDALLGMSCITLASRW